MYEKAQLVSSRLSMPGRHFAIFQRSADPAAQCSRPARRWLKSRWSKEEYFNLLRTHTVALQTGVQQMDKAVEKIRGGKDAPEQAGKARDGILSAMSECRGMLTLWKGRWRTACGYCPNARNCFGRARGSFYIEEFCLFSK